MYNGVELYEKDGKIGVLLNKSYGIGWSTEFDQRLAYDKRVIEFYLSHKDNKIYTNLITCYEENDMIKEAKKLFKSWGYNFVSFLDFDTLVLQLVNKNEQFKIREYDGLEYLEIYNSNEWIKFNE